MHQAADNMQQNEDDDNCEVQAERPWPRGLRPAADRSLHFGPGRRGAWPLFGLALLLAGLAFLAAGCGGPPAAPSSTSSQSADAGPQVDVFAALQEEIRKSSDATAYRGVIQQLNDHLARTAQEKPPPLAEASRQLLAERFHLEPDELAEVANPNFSLLDAHYLEQQTLFRDIAAALQMNQRPALERAVAGFAWVTRQVRPQAHAAPPMPPHLILRRGWGNSQDRALVFLALLQQLHLDGCAVVLPGSNDQTAPVLLTGVLVGKDLHLFDPRLGLPVPGPGGEGVATLAQVQSQPEILRALDGENGLRYDLNADQIKKAAVYLGYPLSALAPRLRWLQSQLVGEESLVLAVDAAAQLQKFQSALPTTPIRAWGAGGDPNTPLRALRAYLLPEEGGTDKGQAQALTLRELVPWQALPRQVVEIPGEPGRRLQVVFLLQFRSFYLDPRTPRDQLLRGRYDEATQRLIQKQDECDKLRTLLHSVKDLHEQAANWRERAVHAYANLARAERAAKSPDGAAALQAARREVDDLWNKPGPLTLIVQAAAAEPLLMESIYQLALCKHEQAVRTQARQGAGGAVAAWRAARNWWDRYLEEYPGSPAAPHARRLRAEALAAQGEPALARAALLDFNGLTDLEKLARYFLARQLTRKSL